MVIKRYNCTMIKQSSLLKWTQNNKANKGNRNWIHSPDSLQRGHIAYLVKFLGCTEVDQPKGIEVVKEGIRKLKFNQQLKRAEGSKTPKVELTISVDGVAIQEPKTKVRWPAKVQELGKSSVVNARPESIEQKILHQYPLHRISYCADDKSDKKFFSFIAKEADADRHTCFVFVSDKLAEEITLTIGQAFDLAYRRFLETSGKDLEIRKQMVVLQKKVQALECENQTLKQRILELTALKDKNDIDNFMRDKNIVDLLIINGDVSSANNNDKNEELLDMDVGLGLTQPSTFQRMKLSSASPSEELLSEINDIPTVGTKLENLVLDDFEDFDPRAEVIFPVTNGVSTSRNGDVPHLSPPPPVNGTRSGHSRQQGKDLFGASPFAPAAGASSSPSDPFGMGDFCQATSNDTKDLEGLGMLEKGFSEMLDGFSRGLSFGNDDFSLESLDPLHKSS